MISTAPLFYPPPLFNPIPPHPVYLCYSNIPILLLQVSLIDALERIAFPLSNFGIKYVSFNNNKIYNLKCKDWSFGNGDTLPTPK